MSMDTLGQMASETAAPRNKRRELGARSRDEILNAALRMMSIYGYEGTSVARMASESGLPSSSIYWHFGSKSGVLLAVMERSADEFFHDSAIEIDRARGPISPRDVFTEALQIAGRAAKQHPEFLRLLFLLTLSGEHDERIATVVRGVTQRGRDSLRSIIELAFSERGPEVAGEVANQLADFAQGVFDGAFITSQTHPDVEYLDLIDRMGESILALGDAIVGRHVAE